MGIINVYKCRDCNNESSWIREGVGKMGIPVSSRLNRKDASFKKGTCPYCKSANITEETVGFWD